MVESSREKESIDIEVKIDENYSPAEVLGIANLNSKQRLAAKIIDELKITQDQKQSIFYYHLWHESGSLNPIKKLKPTMSNSEIREMFDEFMESDELVHEYSNFYIQYKAEEGATDNHY